MSQHVVGAQLYTARELCRSLPELKDTLKRIAGIGYKNVQVSGIKDIEPKDIAEACEAAGLLVVTTHYPWPDFVGDLDRVVADHKMYGCRHLAIGGLPPDYRSAEGVARFVEELKPVSERLIAEGMTFSYHNHNQEFARIGDKTMIETLFDATTPEQLCFELDTYWVQAGGADPAAWIRKCAGRIPLVHLKDMALTLDREQRFAEIGEGNLNWEAILPACREAGAEWYLVEQDNCYDRDPVESLAISYKNLQAMGLS